MSHTQDIGNIITKNEIEESFENDYNESIEKIYYELKEHCDRSAFGVLEHTDSKTLFDFIELFKNNIDIVNVYKKKYNL